MNHSKVLVTGIDGFTGQHLSKNLLKSGFEVVGLNANIINREEMFEEIKKISPNYVVHLAGLSYAGEVRVRELYDVNVQGTVNILDALNNLAQHPTKIILCSSATVYGDEAKNIASEDSCLSPTNHYGCSKLAMECLAKTYFDKLPIIITRPFNYTGIGQEDIFVIPKIVNAYASGKKSIELGNLNIYREFNDVRDVTRVYCELLKSISKSKILNICSGRSICLRDVINKLDKISGIKMQVNVNESFVRLNEIKNLCGSNLELKKIYKDSFIYNLEDTLKWMYKNKAS